MSKINYVFGQTELVLNKTNYNYKNAHGADGKERKIIPKIGDTTFLLQSPRAKICNILCNLLQNKFEEM